MNIVQITPGTGGMYCGNCLRDNALVGELRKLGHTVLMLPLYLPLKLDEADESAGTPIFFGGINVYLEQKLSWFRRAPGWLHRALASPTLLARAAGRSAKTRAEDVGEILLSMLQGREGRQARELEELVAWLKTQPRTDFILLSNALLLGLAGELKTQLNTRVACFLQGEDSYVDSLAAGFRQPAWQLLRERAKHADLFLSPNQYYANVMLDRLQLPADLVRIVPDGIRLEGYDAPPPATPSAGSKGHGVIGYFARMCPEKGLHVLVEAFIRLRRRGTVPHATLKVGGGCGPADMPFLERMKQRLAAAGLLEATRFHPNLDRAQKIAFLKSLDVFSVPVTYAEAFGMYCIEAMAAGVPVVQPRTGGFPELIEVTGGGVVYEPPAPEALTDTLEALLLDPRRAGTLGLAGQRAVAHQFSARSMAEKLIEALGP